MALNTFPIKVANSEKLWSPRELGLVNIASSLSILKTASRRRVLRDSGHMSELVAPSWLVASLAAEPKSVGKPRYIAWLDKMEDS